jgi:hypothetical protein
MQTTSMTNLPTSIPESYLKVHGLKISRDRANGVHLRKTEKRYQKPAQSPPRRNLQLSANESVNVHASHPRR